MSGSPTEAKTEQAARGGQALVIARGLGGALLGGIVGYFVFRWLAGQNFYGIMIIGALMGLCAGFAARGRSPVLGGLCAVLALIAAVLSEWNVFPFVKDKSLAFFLAHIHHLAPIKLIFMALGAAAAYWFGQGR
jgi:hypothetical protein